MKFFHLSDLHLGKRLYHFSLLEEQAYLLDEILALVQEEKPDAVLISGDLYDKKTPSTEAVNLLDDFLTRLSQAALQVFVIAGNHDSAERLAFGHRLMDASGIHIAPAFQGQVHHYTLYDEAGPVHFYLLPYLNPALVRAYYPDAACSSYNEALALVLEGLPLRPSERNVLLTHQFVGGAQRSDSEQLVVGGLDQVDGAIFSAFDYVALGHIHKPQDMAGKRIRYCGSPLKYSFSEARQVKSLTIVETTDKVTWSRKIRPLSPLHDLKEKRGCFSDLMAEAEEDPAAKKDYFHITLTDDHDIPSALAKLRSRYPRLMLLDYDHQKNADHGPLTLSETVQAQPNDLFARFFEEQNGKPLSAQQKTFVTNLFRQLEEEEG